MATERQREHVRKYERTHPDKVKAKRAASRSRKRAMVREAKNVPCYDCGGYFPPRVMDLHHQGEKVFGLSRAATRSLQTVEAELEKCIALCSNCHRERHLSLDCRR